MNNIEKINKKIKELGKNNVTLKIVLVLMAVDIIILLINSLYFKTNLSDYTTGILTEIVGMIITIVFIEKLFNKNKEEKLVIEEKNKIIRNDKVLQILIERYEELFYSVVTPIKSRNENEEIKMPEKFKMSDMKDLFVHPLYARYGITESSIVSFLDIETEIKNYIIESLRTIDFKYNKEIQEMFLKFVTISTKYDTKKAIYEADKLKSGNKKYIEVIFETLEKNGDEFLERMLNGEIKHANIMHPYAFLYIMMNREREIINQYKKLIKRIRN